MFVEERKEKILELLHEKERVSVNELSAQFKLSKVIIRKYLGELENEGLLERTHGGAILKRKVINRVYLMDLMKEDYDKKLKISQKAVQLIKEGDMIFLDGSTITLLIAELLKESEIKITVISNMLNIHEILSKQEHITLISLGGVYDNLTNSFTGDLAKENLKYFNPNKVFVGVAGINLNKMQISTCTIEEGQFKKAILNSGEKKYLLAQDTKFYQDSLFNFSSLTEDITIIGDDYISKENITILKEKNITLI